MAISFELLCCGAAARLRKSSRVIRQEFASVAPFVHSRNFVLYNRGECRGEKDKYVARNGISIKIRNTASDYSAANDARIFASLPFTISQQENNVRLFRTYI